MLRAVILKNGVLYYCVDYNGKMLYLYMNIDGVIKENISLLSVVEGKMLSLDMYCKLNIKDI